MRYLMLRDKKVVETEDLFEWMAACDISVRRVVRTKLPSGSEVSTDFFKTMAMGDEDLSRGFESMVFGGPLNHLRTQYDSWEEAEAGHAAFCAKIEKLEANIKEKAEWSAK